uniref:Uncharacterized protein n=1 Tax=Physcomitrium patens TaxID=3218 RepID=A0A7I3Z722_PHYPA
MAENRSTTAPHPPHFYPFSHRPRHRLLLLQIADCRLPHGCCSLSSSSPSSRELRERLCFPGSGPPLFSSPAGCDLAFVVLRRLQLLRYTFVVSLYVTVYWSQYGGTRPCASHK